MCAHPKSAKKLMTLRNHPFDSQVSNRKFNIPNRQDIPMAAAMLTMIFFFIVSSCSFCFSSCVFLKRHYIVAKRRCQSKSMLLNLIRTSLLISKFTELRTDNQFLLAIAFFDASYYLRIDAKALRDGDDFFYMFW